MKKRSINPVNVAAYMGLFGIFVGFVVLGYYRFWPPRDYVFQFTKPIKIMTDPVVSGGTLKYILSYRKNPQYADLQASITATFVDHAAQPVLVPSGNIPAGEHEIEIDIPVPILKPGTYKLHLSRYYEFSALHNETYTSESEPFQVVAAPPVSSELLNQLHTMVDANRALNRSIGGMLEAHREMDGRVNDLLKTNRDLIEAVKKRR